MAPTPERYKEIQQALIDKRYLDGKATGVWGPESVNALKKFQGDQKMAPTGKLDSLSLIGLGLGTKREPASAAPAPPAVSPAFPPPPTPPALSPAPAASSTPNSNANPPVPAAASTPPASE
jgi:peptidoglycan hydrolase-like protein with peptidoglycan-binding domain